MKIWAKYNITYIINKVKVFTLIALVLLLSGCHDECPTIQDYINKGAEYETNYEGAKPGETTYLMCALFNILIDVAKKIATESWDILALPLVPVVGVVAAIYVAIYTAKLVGSFGKQTANDFMTGEKRGVLMLMFKTVVIIFLLTGGSGPELLSKITGGLHSVGASDLAGAAGVLGENLGNENFLIRKIITPILKSGLEIGGELAVKSDASFNFYDSVEGQLEDVLGVYLRSPWGSLFETIRGALKGFSESTYEPVAIGQAMMCNASEGNFLSWYYLMMIYGLILFTFGWLMSTVIGFYLVDILINLTFAAVLTPIGVACAISDKTMVFTKNIWNVFINVFFSFIILGIVIGMTLQVIDLSLTRGDDPAQTGGALAHFLTNKQAQIDANQIKEMSESLWSSGMFLFTVVCLSVMFGLIGKIGKLAEKISDAAGLSSAGSATGAKVAKPVINQAKQTAAKTYQRNIKPAMSNAGAAFTRITRLDKLYTFGNKARGYLTGSGPQGYRAFWHKRGTWR